MNLHSLRHRLAHLAGAVPRNPPEGTAASAAVCDLLFAEGAVLVALEAWAAKRPGYQPMGPPTVPYEPSAADIYLSKQHPDLAELAEKGFTWAPGVLDTRLSALFAQYEAAGVSDAAIDTALADAGAQLTALIASGADVPSWCADRVAILQRREV